MSTEQRENLDAILRQSAFPAGSDVSEQRRQLAELSAAQPQPAGVTVTAAALVFQAFYPILDEAAAALDRAGQLLTTHLASTDRVTA
jgi:ABC-type Mn2+/Zn2+ transport system ATPase subunit